MMNVSTKIRCELFPCLDVNHDNYILPDVEIDADRVRMIMISEASPADVSDYYYAAGNPLYQETTVQAFKAAGVKVSSIEEILDLGIYLTTAVKCGKTVYGIKATTINECSKILEAELNHFPKVKVLMLMGDTAIKALNYIAKRSGEPRVIPAGSTYKIRGREFTYQAIRVFPSYVQAGPSFFIEKSKRRMIAEDISNALRYIG
jgi:hypothetical protein